MTRIKPRHWDHEADVLVIGTGVCVGITFWGIMKPVVIYARRVSLRRTLTTWICLTSF